MIRVFFNIRLDGSLLPERTGQWVRDAAEARAVACIVVRRLVAAHGGEPRLLDAELAVTLEGGAPLFDLSFFEALYVPVAPPEPEALPLRRAGAIRPRTRLARLRAALAPLRAEVAALAADLVAGGGRLVGAVLRREPPARLRLEPHG